MQYLKILLIVGVSFFVTSVSSAEKLFQESLLYRNLSQSIRTAGKFYIPTVGNTKTEISYQIELGTPLWIEPIVVDNPLEIGSPKGKKFLRSFYDKILLLDGSVLKINDEEIPLSCIYVNAQDNRFSESQSPVFSEFIIRFYLVANNYSCQGPIRPGWPESGGKKEAWDTYLLFEVRDPTIMLPTDIKLRFRWNEFHAVLLDDGRP